MEKSSQPHSTHDASGVVEAARAASQAQKLADDLKARALASEDPETKEKLLAESKAKEIEARKNSRRAHRLASGVWQGGARGLAAGAAIGAGLGTVVGTLVGAIVSIPTTGVGVLVGVPVGWIHGPWAGPGVKQTENAGDGERADGEAEGESQSEGLEQAEDMDEMSDEETHRAVLEAVEAADKLERQQREHTQGGPTVSTVEEPQTQLQQDETAGRRNEGPAREKPDEQEGDSQEHAKNRGDARAASNKVALGHDSD
ncbi:hypothetical protein GGX14DRAFT_545813 [Mycena pura]|uniref:Uncharacterized protein n=1 Tax=Mycena pura TaxID=153505 RepID=A0AAD6UZW8_9AGAR|nr:hypothetical protein GGX14DRAFT_545813 [Mycena pura]